MACYFAEATLRWLKADMAHYFAKAGYNPGQPRVPRGQPGGGQWTRVGGAPSATGAPYGWGNPETLERHVRSHGKDFGITSEAEYAKRAQQFYRRAQQGKLPAVRGHDGVLRVYDTKTNTFGSYNPDGSTRTFYKPRDGIRYFRNQIAKHVAEGGRIIRPLPEPPTGGGRGGRLGGGFGPGVNRFDIINKPKLY